MATWLRTDEIHDAVLCKDYIVSAVHNTPDCDWPRPYLGQTVARGEPATVDGPQPEQACPACNHDPGTAWCGDHDVPADTCTHFHGGRTR